MKLTSKIILGGLAVILIAAGLIFWLGRDSESDEPRTITAAKGTLVQDVEFTGRIKSAQAVALAFEQSGTLQDIFVAEGQTVAINQPLARLDPSSAGLAVDQAFADQAAAEEQQRLAWEKTAHDAANIEAANAKTVARYQQSVRDAKAELDQAKEFHQQVASEYGDTSTTNSALNTLKLKQTSYNATRKLLEETLASTAQNNAAATASAKNAKAAYLSTTQASGSQPGLSSLEARLAAARLQVDKTTLTAPFEGTISFQHKKIGETAAAHTPIITLETISDLEIEAGVTETDAVKLAAGQLAAITFDALPPNERYDAAISSISPAAQIIEGVPTYTVRLQLVATAPALKPGFTANITVHTATRENVIAIPRRAIITQQSEQFVLILPDDGTIRRQAVSTGLSGSEGTIEITHGISVGERVIVDSRTLRDQP